MIGQPLETLLELQWSDVVAKGTFVVNILAMVLLFVDSDV
jgi:hypothetical protein